MRPIVLCTIWGTISCAGSTAGMPEDAPLQKRSCHQDGSASRPAWTQHSRAWVYRGSVFAVGLAELRSAGLGSFSAKMNAINVLNRRLGVMVSQKTVSLTTEPGGAGFNFVGRRSSSFAPPSGLIVETRCVWTDGIFKWAVLVEHRLKDRACGSEDKPCDPSGDFRIRPASNRLERLRR